MKVINRVLKENGKLVILNVNWEKANGKEFLSFKLDYFHNLTSGQKVGGILKGKRPVRIDDYFWSRNDYCSMLEESSFKVMKVAEPIARDRSREWLNERKISPFIILTAEKR